MGSVILVGVGDANKSFVLLRLPLDPRGVAGDPLEEDAPILHVPESGQAFSGWALMNFTTSLASQKQSAVNVSAAP